jgi:hypothetical protein
MKMPLILDSVHSDVYQGFISTFPAQAIDELNYISRRAAFLASATDDQLREDEILQLAQEQG